MAEGSGRKLVLFRHAKSAWPDVADHERPLAPRGKRDAPVMGRWLRDSGHAPDRVLCSTARRAQETWQFALKGLEAKPPVTFERGVYQASAAADLLALIQKVDPRARTLVVIGHNPVMEELALMLAAPAPGTSVADGLERMGAKFPTGAIAVLEFTGTWHGLGEGRAQLTAFVTPRDLGAQDKP